MSFIYVASPYTAHRLPNMSDSQFKTFKKMLENERFESVSRFCAAMFKNGMVVYSPIAHNHHIAVKYNIQGDFDFWQSQNFPMLSKASRLYVLRLDGWDKSKGVKNEIYFAKQCGIPITHVKYSYEKDQYMRAI